MSEEKENENDNYISERKESFLETFKKRLNQLRIGPPGNVKTTNRSMESLMNSGSITGFFRRLFDRAQEVLSSKPSKNLNTIQKISISDSEKSTNTLDKSVEPSKTNDFYFPGLDNMKNPTVASVQAAQTSTIDATTIEVAESGKAPINTETQSHDDSSIEVADISLDEDFKSSLEEIPESEITQESKSKVQATTITVNPGNNITVDKNQEKDEPEI